MSIAIIFNYKDPEIWKVSLEEKISNVLIEIYPDIKDKTKVDFILCWKPQPGVISEFPNVKVIQSVGASAEQVLFSQRLDDSVTVARIVDPGLSNDMFEFLLSALMFKLKNLDRYAADQRKRIWCPLKYTLIKNTSITVLGLGQIGYLVAERLSALGFKVKGWSNSKKQISGVQCFYGISGFGDAIRGSDFLINILPLTPDTKEILNFDSLSLLNSGGTLVNVGRGEHLVEDDLINLLDSGHLSGAILDVFREEPLPAQHPFWENPLIVITPHIASITNVSTAADVITENYRRMVSGQTLLYTVSKTDGY